MYSCINHISFDMTSATSTTYKVPTKVTITLRHVYLDRPSTEVEWNTANQFLEHLSIHHSIECKTPILTVFQMRNLVDMLAQSNYPAGVASLDQHVFSISSGPPDYKLEVYHDLQWPTDYNMDNTMDTCCIVS